MTIAKGLTSAYAPLSGSIVSDKMWRVLEHGTDAHGAFGHGWTYSAHPICAAAGVANLKLIDSLDLVRNAGTVGPYLTDALSDALSKHDHVGEVRGEGMLSAVELVSDKGQRLGFDPVGSVAPQVVAKMQEHGVIARAMPQSDTIGFAPPLSLSEKEADQIVSATVAAISEAIG